METKPLFKLKDAARALGVSEYYLRRAAIAGEIPACKPSGKWLIDVPRTRAVLMEGRRAADGGDLHAR